MVGPKTVIYATGGTLDLEQSTKFVVILVLFCSKTICCIKSEINVKGKDDCLVRTQSKKR